MPLPSLIEPDFISLLHRILLIALLLCLIKLIRKVVITNVFIVIIVLWVSWELIEILQIKITDGIIKEFIGTGTVILIIIFQPEIRKFLLTLRLTSFFNKFSRIYRFKISQHKILPVGTDVKAIMRACKEMTVAKTGALIVIARYDSLDFVKTTGDAMSIRVTQPILESIFFKNSPLHDGAVVVEGNFITATRVVLPIPNNRNTQLKCGLRHHAAMGITGKTDALCLVVSEETGSISYMKYSEFVPYENLEDLTALIEKDLRTMR